jgi:hypothetical protein
LESARAKVEKNDAKSGSGAGPTADGYGNDITGGKGLAGDLGSELLVDEQARALARCAAKKPLVDQALAFGARSLATFLTTSRWSNASSRSGPS